MSESKFARKPEEELGDYFEERLVQTSRNRPWPASTNILATRFRFAIARWSGRWRPEVMLLVPYFVSLFLFDLGRAGDRPAICKIQHHVIRNATRTGGGRPFFQWTFGGTLGGGEDFTKS